MVGLTVFIAFSVWDVVGVLLFFVEWVVGGKVVWGGYFCVERIRDNL